MGDLFEPRIMKARRVVTEHCFLEVGVTREYRHAEVSQFSEPCARIDGVTAEICFRENSVLDESCVIEVDHTFVKLGAEKVSMTLEIRADEIRVTLLKSCV